MPAKVNEETCTGCGICVDECPSNAIELVDDKAKVNKDECTECEVCVDECPNEAITIE